MKNLSFLIFVILAFCCWGTYGPTLHNGQAAMGADGQLSSLRPFICVGLAYFLIAVLVPALILMLKGEKGNWSISGFVWSFIAGAVGAIGALGITLAFKFKGSPVYVMPLVFGCAPIVNTIVTMLMARTLKQASAVFYLGILIVAIGAAGVLIYKPTAPKAHSQSESVVAGNLVSYVSLPPQEETETDAATIEDEAPTENETSATLPASKDASPLAPAASIESAKPTIAKQASNLMGIILSVLVTAICWGAYGAVLHKGQAKMNGSRLRPFLCVGLAYFAIAVVVPFFLEPYFQEPGGWNTPGVLWSMLGGAVGAIGALGIIYAFNFGGKPVFVMPLVFGFAPVVNTLVETTSKGLFNQLQPMFFVSMALVITGAVIVLVFAPRSAPHAPSK